MTQAEGSTPAGPMWSGAGGASGERTRLSWRRTVLATTVTVLLMIRLALRTDLTPVRAVAITVTVSAWIFHLWIAQRRIDAMGQEEPPPAGRVLPVTAMVIIGYAIIGIVLTAITL